MSEGWVELGLVAWACLWLRWEREVSCSGFAPGARPRSRAPHCSLSPILFWLGALEETWDHESLGKESLLDQD